MFSVVSKNKTLSNTNESWNVMTAIVNFYFLKLFMEKLGLFCRVSIDISISPHNTFLSLCLSWPSVIFWIIKFIF